MNALPYESKEIAEDVIRELGELPDERRRQVFQLSHRLQKTLHLRRRSQGDPQVPAELQRSAQGISFDDVRFNRERGAECDSFPSVASTGTAPRSPLPVS